MSTADKLNKLIETKEAIRQSIISKGTDVGTDVPFSQYPSKINEIQTGTVEGDPFVQKFYNVKMNNGNWTYLFSNWNSDADLSKINTSHVNTLDYAFQSAGGNINCSGWDLSGVNGASYVFSSAYCNIDITGWDLSNTYSAYGFLSNFSGSIDISNLRFNDYCYLSSMFNYANLSNVRGLKNFRLPLNAPDITNFFYGAGGINEIDLTDWNIDIINTAVPSFYGMFAYSSFEKINLTGWIGSNVIDVGCMFEGINNLKKLIIPDLDLTNANGCESMFGWEPNSLYNLRYIDISRCNETTINKIVPYLPTKDQYNFGEIALPEGTSEDTVNMLLGKYWKPVNYSANVSSCSVSTKYDEILIAEPIEINISSCEPWYGNIETVEIISSNDSVLTVDVEGNVNALSLGSSDIYVVRKDTKEIISNTITINVVEEYTVSNVFKFRTNGNPPMYYKINEVELTGENCSYDDASGIWTYDPGENVTRAYSGYYGDSNITEIINLDPTHIYSFNSLFWFCCSLRDINMRNWTNIDLSSITTLRNTFYYCYSLTELDLSNWNLGAIDALCGTFQDCHGLTTLNIANWELNPTYCEVVDVFANCHNLRSITCNVANTINRLIGHLPGTNGTIYTTCNTVDLDLNYINNMGWIVESSYQA